MIAPAHGVEAPVLDSPGSPALALQQIDVSFGPHQVLRTVDLSVRAGSVHSLLGANGAGKSTLMKVATGHVAPTAGRITIGGQEVRPGSVKGAAAAGLGMVYQDLSLIPSLTAADNVFLSRPTTVSRTGLLRRGTEADEAADMFESLGVGIDPRAEVGTLNLADRQVVEIAKALTTAASCLILDEPTTALSAHEVDRLFALVQHLAGRGMGVVFITHHLKEVFEICDEVTVLRDGRRSLSSTVSDVTMRDVVSAIVAPGTTVGGATSGTARRDHEPVLTAEAISFGGDVDRVSLKAWPGEIVGIAGLSGSGSHTMLRALAGILGGATGHITVEGRRTRVPQTPLESARRGIFLIPGDRKSEGLVLGATIEDNIALSVLRSLRRGPFMSDRKLRSLATRFMKELRIKANSPEQPVDELSGGNQQKVVLAKAIATDASVLLLEEPTFGVDVQASAEIASQIRTLVDNGATCLWLSNDLRELREATDRILVFTDGEITHEFANSAETTEAQLLEAMHSVVGHESSGGPAHNHDGEQQ